MTNNNTIEKAPSRFITAQEIAEEMHISTGKAYQIIKELNDELRQKNAVVIRGRVLRSYYVERLAGGSNGD